MQGDNLVDERVRTVTTNTVDDYAYDGLHLIIIYNDDKPSVYVTTNLQAFKLVIINNNGAATHRRIIRGIQSKRIRDFNGLCGSLGKSVQMQPIRFRWLPVTNSIQ